MDGWRSCKFVVISRLYFYENKLRNYREILLALLYILEAINEKAIDPINLHKLKAVLASLID